MFILFEIPLLKNIDDDFSHHSVWLVQRDNAVWLEKVHFLSILILIFSITRLNF